MKYVIVLALVVALGVIFWHIIPIGIRNEYIDQTANIEKTPFGQFTITKLQSCKWSCNTEFSFLCIENGNMQIRSFGGGHCSIYVDGKLVNLISHDEMSIICQKVRNIYELPENRAIRESDFIDQSVKIIENIRLK